MASRAEQKAALRAAREARQKELTAAQTRRKRMYSLGALLAGVLVALVVVIVAGGGSSSPTHTTNPKTAKAAVVTLLKGIPQNGNTLGKPSAPVTVTEYGDLVCPICQQFTFTSAQQLIDHEIRAGKVKFVFRGLETASST